MRILKSLNVAATVFLFYPVGTVYATQPTYGEFKLDFAKPPRPGEPSKLLAKFVYWMSCKEGELVISIPMIGNEPPRKLSCWNGPVVVNDTISATIEIPPLPKGAYQFRAECRPKGCGAFSDEPGGAAVSVWVTTEGVVTAPFGYDYGMLDTIFNHLEIEKLGGATKQGIRERSPQLYRVMYGDFSIPLDTSADPRKATTFVSPPPIPRAKPLVPDSLDRTTTIKAIPRRADRPQRQNDAASSELDPPRIRLPHAPPAGVSGDSTTIIIDSGRLASPERIEEVRRLRDLYLRDLPDSVISDSPSDTAPSPIDLFQPIPRRRNP